MDTPRKRVGLIVPSSNSTVEYDFQLVASQLNGSAAGEISVHTGRVWLVDTTPEMLEQMNEDAEAAARLVATAGVDVISYACTSGSFLGGPGYDEQLLARITKAADDLPAVGTTPAVIAALREVGAARVAVVTPYIDSINERLTRFLQAEGFDVASMAGQQLVANLDIGNQTPERIAAFSREHLARDVDAFFLSCTNWRAMEVAEALESELGRPVVTSNQATIWATLRALGYGAPITGYGQLMSAIGQTAAAG